ncbi:hypothetical protein BCD67_24865 [Oscillatoriales cyanobacterium USR001]|nr:hypothetical protein BCD67_24865 [Oscillatoriales cyanobacterium USR001]
MLMLNLHLDLLLQASASAQATEMVNLTIAYSNAVTAYVVDFAHKLIPLIVYVSTFMIIMKKS